MDDDENPYPKTNFTPKFMYIIRQPCIVVVVVIVVLGAVIFMGRRR